jgi:secondary thiamine-phosphate synthase enzyme
MSDKKNSLLHVSSSRKVQLIDITQDVSGLVRKSGVKEGVCFIYVPHTTAGVTINENADPDVVSDIIMGLDRIVSSRLSYRHGEGNSPAHIKSSIIGNSVNVFVENGELVFGTWQGIYFCEFDGPRSRKIHIKILTGTS